MALTVLECCGDVEMRLAFRLVMLAGCQDFAVVVDLLVGPATYLGNLDTKLIERKGVFKRPAAPFNELPFRLLDSGLRRSG